jgi:hypothetical protein
MKYISWIDTNPGHIVIFICLIIFGLGVYKSGLADIGKEIISGSMGALLYSMKAGNKS